MRGEDSTRVSSGRGRCQIRNLRESFYSNGSLEQIEKWKIVGIVELGMEYL